MAGREKRRSIPRTFADNYGPMKTEFYAAQGGICPLCGKNMSFIEECNYDHVETHMNGGKIYGNVVLTHVSCNSRRPGTMDPCKFYREILKVVNERLGWDEELGYTKTYRYHQKLLEKSVISLHWRFNIKIKRLSKAFKVYGVKADDLDVVIDHFNKLFYDIKVNPIITNKEVYLYFKHNGMRNLKFK
jgi:hypothetical protein